MKPKGRGPIVKYESPTCDLWNYEAKSQLVNYEIMETSKEVVKLCKLYVTPCEIMEGIKRIVRYEPI